MLDDPLFQNTLQIKQDLPSQVSINPKKRIIKFYFFRLDLSLNSYILKKYIINNKSFSIQ